MQDNAPANNARSTLDFFDENNIEVLANPSLSPYLNPIEFIWKQMKDNIEKKQPKNIKKIENLL